MMRIIKNIHKEHEYVYLHDINGLCRSMRIKIQNITATGNDPGVETSTITEAWISTVQRVFAEGVRQELLPPVLQVCVRGFFTSQHKPATGLRTSHFSSI